MKTKMIKVLVVAFTMAMVMGVTSNQTKAAQIHGRDINFDVHNFTGQTVDDLELILYTLTCADIERYFSGGWGTVNGQPSGGCQDLGGGRVKITYSDPNNPVPPCTWKHFGFWIKPGIEEVYVEQATWTFDGDEVGHIFFTFPGYRGLIACPVEETIYPPGHWPGWPFGPPVIIKRRWAWSPIIIPLDSLNRYSSMVQGLNWNEVPPDTMFMDTLVLLTDPLPQHGAAIFQYSVTTLNGDSLLFFTNEAELESEAIPTLTEWGLIIFGVVLLGFISYVFLRRRRPVVSVQ